MYKNYVLFIVYLQLFNVCLNFNNFDTPEIKKPAVEKPEIDIFDYCSQVQIETKNFYESKNTLGQGSFGAVKEIDENFVVKIQEIPIENEQNKDSKKVTSLSTKGQLDDEIYFLNVVKNKLQEQNVSQDLQDKFLILQKCEIYISEEENKYYYYQILQKYQADLEYKYDNHFRAVSVKGLHIINYMYKAKQLLNIQKRLVQMSIDLFEQLEFLHRNNLVHGDIKADNILVKSPISLEQMKNEIYGPNFNDDTYDLTFTLGDYGLTRYEFENIKLINLYSTHPALQMSFKKQKYAVRQSDIYSMAITILTAVQYKEGQRDILYYRDVLYTNIYQDLSKYDINELDLTFKDNFIRLKQKVKETLQLQDQRSMADCQALGCVLYFSFAQNLMKNIPKASKILKYLYKINNNLQYGAHLEQRMTQWEFQDTFEQIQDLIIKRCHEQIILLIEMQYQMESYILSNHCSASLTNEAFKFKKNQENNFPKDASEQLHVYTSKVNYQNWQNGIIAYQDNVEIFKNFINYDFYFQKKEKDTSYFQGVFGTSMEKQFYLYTFYYFNFSQNNNELIPQQILIDEKSKFTSNFINLFEGIKFLQEQFLVFQNISPLTIVQTTYFNSLKDLNLKMLASPIYDSNMPFLDGNYSDFFTYPLSSFKYYNYQADTYSMSLTCIYIILKIYYKDRRRKIDMQLLDNIQQMSNNNQGKIAQVKLNVEKAFKLVFGYDITRTNNCQSIKEFPENLICVLMKQIQNMVDYIESPQQIIDQIQQIHSKLSGNRLRRSVRIQLKYYYISLQFINLIFIYFFQEIIYILKLTYKNQSIIFYLIFLSFLIQFLI